MMNPKAMVHWSLVGVWSLVMLGALSLQTAAEEPGPGKSQPATKNAITKTVVTPANPAVSTGQGQQFIATAFLNDGTNQDITKSAHWSSSSVHIATINSGQTGGGLATTNAAGTVTITAMLNGVSGSTTLTVNSTLDQVLRSMDENAAKFRTAQADFVWTPYNSVINEKEAPDNGRIYFRKVGKEIQMAALINPPDNRQIVFSEGKIQVFQPRTKVLDVYDASAHKAEVESFLVLGFGSSGDELRKSFEIKYLGDEKIGPAQTAHLQLTPLAEKVKKSFPRIDLWIDPLRGLSLRQQLFQTGGDYRLADYTNIRVDEKVPDSAFKIKTSGTKTVTH